MNEALSARGRGGNDEYYEYSPLGIFYDTYSTLPVQYNHERNVNYAQTGHPGVAVDPPHPANRPAYCPAYCTAYLPYQSQAPALMDLDLLSAENYQEAPYNQRVSEQHESGSIQIYGGFLASTTHETKVPRSSTSMTTRRSSKKGISKGVSADETATRQRGRPRLDNRDQTASERRRTQIRLAQRAYRQRKETTISGLNRRVDSLGKTIEDVHKVFLDFRETAIAGGIQKSAPSLAKHLDTATKRISELLKTSKHELNKADEELNPNPSTPPVGIAENSTSHSRRTAAVMGSNRAPMLGYQTIFEEEPDDYDGETAHQGVAQSAQMDQIPLSDWTAAEAMQQYQSNPPDEAEAIGAVIEPVQQYRVEIPGRTIDLRSSFSTNTTMFADHFNPSVEKPSLDLMSLPIPKSHSYHETSFARRLVRATIERGIRLMTDPNSSQEDLNSVCRFTWCFESSSDMTEKMLDLSGQTTRDSLEHWEAPRLHLGGAGLHFPRANMDGESSPPAWWANEVPMGPRRPGQPETPVPNTMTITDIIRKVQVEGDWFDSSDVEQYLRSKGLYLDGQSSIVEIIEPEDSVPELQETQMPSTSTPDASSPLDTTREPRSPEVFDSNWFSDPSVSNTDYGWTVGMTNLAVPDINMDFSVDTIDYPNSKALDPSFDLSLYTGPMPTFTTKIRKFLDVDKFLDNISQHGTCLGRTSGYRKSAVDSALDSATIEHVLTVAGGSNGEFW